MKYSIKLLPLSPVMLKSTVPPEILRRPSSTIPISSPEILTVPWRTSSPPEPDEASELLVLGK